MGTGNDNIEEVLRTNEKKNEVCGVKVFMGSSTGNLLVDNPLALEKVFGGVELLLLHIAKTRQQSKETLKNLKKKKKHWNLQTIQ